MMKLLTFFSILLIAASCDFSTHEYITYRGHNWQYNSKVDLGWGDEGDCSISFYNTSFVFDEVEIEFPSDQSRIKSELVRSCYYTYDDEGVNVVDSTIYWNYEFDLKEDDPRVPLNDSIFVYYFLKSKKVEQDTLFREKFSTDFVDRLPLPKLH